MKKKILSILFLVSFSIPLLSVIQPPLLIGPENLFLSPNSDFPIQKPDKKSKVPTKWGGASLTQIEKSFNGFPMKTFLLGGGAWIYHNKIKLSSNEIEIIGEDAIRAELKGRVEVEDFENQTYFYANKGFYDKVTEKVVLEGRPRLFHTSKEKKKTKISAEKITRYLNEGKTVLEGRVYIENDDLRVVGENATYYESSKKLEIVNRPFIFAEHKFLTAERLVYNTESNEISLEENAFLVQISEESQSPVSLLATKKKKESTVEEKKSPSDPQEKKTSIFIADKMIHISSGENKSTGLVGNAKIFRPDGEFSADNLKSIGNNGELIQANGNIRMLDTINHTVLSGQFLEHFKIKQYSYMSGQPKIEMLDKDNQNVQSTVTAVVIERFIDKKEIVTRGDVKIQSQSSIARGEFATYYEQEEKIVLEGNPSLERDKKILYSGKIIIYPQEDRVLLSEGMNLKGTE
jgi:lipopolysaccharide export system protein LptA